MTIKHMCAERSASKQVPPYLSDLARDIESVVNLVIDSMQKQRQPDIMKHFASRVPMHVICHMLGIPRTDAPQAYAWAQASRTNLSFENQTNSQVQVFMALCGYIGRLVAKRRVRPAADLISAMLHSSAKPRMTDAEIVLSAISLLATNHESTIENIADGAKALLENRAPVLYEMTNFQPETHFCLSAPLVYLEYKIALKIFSRRMCA